MKLNHRFLRSGGKSGAARALLADFNAFTTSEVNSTRLKRMRMAIAQPI